MLLPLNYAKPLVVQCPFPRLQIIQIPKKSVYFLLYSKNSITLFTSGIKTHKTPKPTIRLNISCGTHKDSEIQRIKTNKATINPVES